MYKIRQLKKRNRISFEITPYLIYFMFIVYVGIKPASELLKITFEIGIRGVDSAMTIAILLYVFLKLRQIFISRYSLYYRTAFFTLVLIITIQVISYPLIISYGNQYLFDFYIGFFSSVTRFCIFLWIVGSNIDYVFAIGDNKKIKLFTYAIYIAFIALFFMYKAKYFIDTGPGSGIFGASVAPSEYYLYYGDIFALFTLWILNICDNKTIKAILGVNGLYWLYLIGSRTSLYCYAIVLMVITLRSFIKDSKKAVMVIAIVCIASYIVSLNIDSILNSGFLSEGNRMARGLVAVEQDDSYQARQVQLEEGLLDIRQFWLTGRFLREYERAGTSGEYIHNILSYWVEYGLLPFLLITLLSIASFYKNFSRYLKYPEDKLISFSFCCSSFIIIAAFTSRSYGYPYIWLAISISARLNEIREKVNLSTRQKNIRGDGLYEGMHAAKEGHSSF